MSENELFENETTVMIAHGFGLLASTAFILQYLPQAVFNYRRKSVRGFSSDSIVFKYIGACFLFVNCVLIREKFPVTFYGFFNVLQHAIFLVQFTIYQQPMRLRFFLWICFPVVPFLLGSLLPASLPFTNAIKPLCQVISHVPQLRVCVEQKTTAGLSLMTQHLNMFGGIAGLIMCALSAPASSLTYFLYINSILQAVSLYWLAIRYDGISVFKITPASLQLQHPTSPNILPTTSIDSTK